MNSKFAFTPCETLKAKPQDESKLGFGKIFTDYMFLMDYNRGQGWHDMRIVPFGPIPLNPASTVLHYGVEIFEGLKAYRTADGRILTFRPDCNAQRMIDSAERLCLPPVDADLFTEIIDTLVELEKDWVPHSEGTSLYIRPFMFGDDEALGVHAAKHAVFAVILSPVGSYYPEGMNPVKIAIESHDVRAVRGGTGYAKCGGNYAASLRAGEKAEEKGFTQVLWLDGVYQKYIEEVGAMNVMFKINGKIVTPKLTGSVLPGVTRRSCVQLLTDMGYEVEERLISIDEVIETIKSGAMEECFGTGTAAVISPVGWLVIEDVLYPVGNSGIGPVSQKLYDTLTGIQWGNGKDEYGWSHFVCNA